MKVSGTIYECYFDVKPSVDEEEIERVEDAKWYNLAMKRMSDEFKEVLDECESISDTKSHQYLSKLHSIIEKNIDNPIDLLKGKAKCEYLNASLDAICEQMDNHKNVVFPPKWYELNDAFETYIDYVDEWTRLVWLEDFGPELAKKQDLKNCQYLPELIEDLAYYSSIKSNPDINSIEDTKRTLNAVLKWVKKNKVGLDTNDQILSYCYDAKCYLTGLSELYSKSKIKKAKR